MAGGAVQLEPRVVSSIQLRSARRTDRGDAAELFRRDAHDEPRLDHARPHRAARGRRDPPGFGGADKLTTAFVSATRWRAAAPTGAWWSGTSTRGIARAEAARPGRRCRGRGAAGACLVGRRHADRVGGARRRRAAARGSTGWCTTRCNRRCSACSRRSSRRRGRAAARRRARASGASRRWRRRRRTRRPGRRRCAVDARASTGSAARRRGRSDRPWATRQVVSLRSEQRLVRDDLLSLDGKSFVTNSADRIIRRFAVSRVLAGEKAALRELQTSSTACSGRTPPFVRLEHVIDLAATSDEMCINTRVERPPDGAADREGRRPRDRVPPDAADPDVLRAQRAARGRQYSQNWPASRSTQGLDENEEHEEKRTSSTSSRSPPARRRSRRRTR